MGKTIFALGTGRCGTTFLYKVFAQERMIASHHERHPLSDTFHRYVKWNHLPVDHAGFLAIKEEGILNDLESHEVSFEASAYMSFSVKELSERFDARFILLLRDPHKVVNSYIQKGWYEKEIIRDDVNKAVNFQPKMKLPHHSFSRIIPTGVEGEKWASYTQVGKLAWYWNALNRKCIDQLKQLQKDKYKIIRLEDLSHDTFISLEPLFGRKFQTIKEDYENLVKSKPNKLHPQRTVESWSAKEREEYHAEVQNLAMEYNYSIDFDHIVEEERAMKNSVEKVSVFKKFFG